jgi:hypothetical protein
MALNTGSGKLLDWLPILVTGVGVIWQSAVAHTELQAAKEEVRNLRASVEVMRTDLTVIRTRLDTEKKVD